MKELHKYKRAKLVKGTDKGKPYYYVEFSATDSLTGKFKRKRLTFINSVTDLKQRENLGNEVVEKVNKLLEKGFHFNDKKFNDSIFFKKEVQTANYYTLESALNFAYNLKKVELSERSKTSYKSSIKIFLEYCDFYSLRHQNVKMLAKKDVINFTDYIKINKEYKGSTINAVVNQLKSTFNTLLEREIVTENHFRNIKKAKEIISVQNKAYSEKEIQKIKKEISAKDSQLWFFCQFIFYSFARPNEIRQIRYKDIDFQNRYIYINATISKTKRERYIYINDTFLELLKKELPKDYNPSHLIFNLNTNTPEKPIGRNTLITRYRKILDKLNFTKEYTLYSWKHTGNVLSYKQGVDIHTLMRQNGHTSIETTIKYLKSLGLQMDKDLYGKFNKVSI
ncbi:tyrosine-type recombinase/integrase [Capnocytophaga canis]|uniref:tyrosine-type recombinase/integrase n=1 Tax=Capnocytophaga canis TaxID=1848903 RepID=UPI001561BFB9|nr:site-specific integrase [Capnocytophaga canis]